MLEILTVCTGNVCRSPLAEQLLRGALRPPDVQVHSAGTRALHGSPMTPEAVQLAIELGVEQEDADAHRGRMLTDSLLRTPDLILAMTRDHRRAIVELAPSRLRSAFTVREFARLAAHTPDDAIREAAERAGADAGARVRAASAVIAAQRGLAPPADDPADDDVIDPYGRSWKTYRLSGSQLSPAVDEVARALRVALIAA